MFSRCSNPRKRGGTQNTRLLATPPNESFGHGQAVLRLKLDLSRITNGHNQKEVPLGSLQKAGSIRQPTLSSEAMCDSIRPFGPVAPPSSAWPSCETSHLWLHMDRRTPLLAPKKPWLLMILLATANEPWICPMVS